MDNIQGEINACKIILNQTDYNAYKLIEGLISAMEDATAVTAVPTLLAWLRDARQEYRDVLRLRAQMRARINELEQEKDEWTLV